MIKVIIVDDHAVVRKGLKQIIEDAPDIYVSDEAASGTELLEKLSDNKYDVVMLDISMPDKDGLDTLKDIRFQAPELPVLIFTVYPEEQYAMRVLKSGAAGYINKECEPEEIIKAIRKVAEGRKYISPELAEILANSIDGKGHHADHENLSDREFQVMLMIASGKTVKEIAAELSLSVNTISTYRIRILEKMKMKNNAEITRYAINNKLV